MEAAMNSTIKVIRSLLITSSDGLLVRQINKEYLEEVGEPIPFGKFGFSTLSDFLRSSNQFVGTKTADGIKVTARINENSAHIIEMRRRQNVSQAEKKRRKRTKTNSNTMNRPPMKSTLKLPPSKGGVRKGAIMKPATKQYARPPQNMYQPVRPPQNVNQLSATSGRPANIPQSANWQTQSQRMQMNKPPASVSKLPSTAAPSQKSNLHSRFVPKNFSMLPDVPTKQVPPTVVVSPVPSHTVNKIESPKTPPFDEQSKPTHSFERLTQKQPVDSANTTHKNLSNSTSHGRAMLKKLNKLQQQQKNCSESVVQEASIDSNSEKRAVDLLPQLEIKKAETPDSSPDSSVNELTKHNLYSRLPPKNLSPSNIEQVKNSSAVGIRAALKQICQQQKCSGIRQKKHESKATSKNQPDEKIDLHSRLGIKETNRINKELEKVGQRVSRF